jgi:hypothetical protein
MLPETIMSTWIPALHAGMTQIEGALLEMTEVSEPRIFKAAFYRSAMDTVASWLNLPHLAYDHFRRLNNML